MLFPDVHNYLVSCQRERIEPGRRAELAPVTQFIEKRVSQGQPARLVFICTHNSRRSQLAQVWMRIAADFFGLAEVDTYSGGSEVTACHPHTLATLSRAGLSIEPATNGNNPLYLVRYDDQAAPLKLFSKRYSHMSNPREDYCAVMTCAEADAACPIVPGAAQRLALSYEDPKSADGTAGETTVYDGRSRQICSEMIYALCPLGS